MSARDNLGPQFDPESLKVGESVQREKSWVQRTGQASWIIGSVVNGQFPPRPRPGRRPSTEDEIAEGKPFYQSGVYG